MAKLGANRYGKSRVRMSRITRLEDRNEFNEWTVNVMLYGDFEASYTEADNSKVLPTDTMKNTVYVVARGSKAGTIEDFAKELGNYFLDNNIQVAKVSIVVEEKAWERLIVDGAPDATTFKLGGPELNTALAVRDQERRVGSDLGSGWADHPEDSQLGVYGIREGPVNYTETGHRPHPRHAGDSRMGLCG